MTAIRLQGFAGIAPKYSDRLLPEQAAVAAANVKLVSGELRGLHEALPVADFTSLAYTVRRAFRIPGSVASPVPIDTAVDTWLPFEDEAVDFVRTPVQGDSFERYYWTGAASPFGGVPKYSTRARLLAANPPYRLGVPRPAAAPTVVPPAGVALTRAYVYTFVSAFGEEGQPSDATLATGAAGTWQLSNIDATVPNAADRNITTVRIYRTRPGFSSTQFFQVADIALGTTTYADSIADEVVATNPILESTSWAEPPAGLQGLTVHPGGFLVGFAGRDLYMSEPYRPHAWPAENVITMQTEIVGLAVYNNSVVVTTNSHPYVIEGVSPVSMNPQKLDSIEPCLSRRSVVTTLEGVMFASVHGIVRIGLGGIQLLTRQLLTRDEWYARYNPEGIQAAPYGLQYIAFDTPQSGFILSPSEQLAPLSELDRFASVRGVQVDAYSGDVYLVRANRVELWDPVGTVPYAYQWRSKVFHLPRPVNLGALQVKFRNIPAEITAAAVADYQAFNTARIQSPLNTLNLAPVNGVRRVTIPAWPFAQNKTPTGGSPLFRISALLAVIPAVTVRVWARMQDSTMGEVFSFTVTDELSYRLPADYMSDVFQMEIVSNTDVYSLALAETEKELGQV